MTELRLTKKQKELQEELDKIVALVGHDYWALEDLRPEWRTTVLQVIRREVIRGEVVSQYTLIDEQLGSKIASYMFKGKFSSLWKTKRFERFNYFILEKMSLLEKLAFVKDVFNVPKAIAADIEAINAIRNALAHAYFPENLRAYRPKLGASVRSLRGPLYKGIDVFTLSGIERFLEDAGEVVQFLISEIRRKKKPAKEATPAEAAALP